MADPFSPEPRRRDGAAATLSPSLDALRLLLLPFPGLADVPDAAPPVALAAPASGAAPPSFAAGYAEFRDAALARPAVAASYLATIRRQADALAMVWEAHGRGAVTLPPSVAEAVGRAVQGL